MAIPPPAGPDTRYAGKPEATTPVFESKGGFMTRAVTKAEFVAMLVAQGVGKTQAEAYALLCVQLGTEVVVNGETVVVR